jgi:hypothetical protein
VADLEDKIYSFLKVWQAKVGDSALNAVNNALNYTNQQTDLEPVFNAVNKAVNYTTVQQTDLEPDFKIKVYPNGVLWALTFKQSYWTFIEHGVNGLEKNQNSKYSFKKKSPVPQDAVEHFIQKRSITLKSLKKYGRANLQEISLKSRKKVRKSLKGLSFEQERKTLTYILGRSIKKKGFKARPFVDNILTDDLMNELKTGMAKIFGEEVLATIKKPD